jgi:hypothetical protein
MLKNDVNLLQIKYKNQENIISIMKREIDDLNLEHANEIEQIKKELTNVHNLMNHYKGYILYLIPYFSIFKNTYIILFDIECYEKEVDQTKKLTANILENKDYVCSLITSLNDAENKFSTLSNEFEQYKSAKENTIIAISNKLNASEEIVKQLLPGN